MTYGPGGMNNYKALKGARMGRAKNALQIAKEKKAGESLGEVLKKYLGELEKIVKMLE